MYTNLILFLVAIFLFSIDSVPESPFLQPFSALFLFILLLVAFDRIAATFFARTLNNRSSDYFKVEKQLSILALIFFGISIYGCDPKYYLSSIPFAANMPALVNIFGLCLFGLFLGIMWYRARPGYSAVFYREYKTSAFILSNIKTNLPIVLPWIILSLLYDTVALVPYPALQKLVGSEWGDLIFFGVFLCFVLVFFPPLVRRLWGCRKLPDSLLKNQLTAICSKYGFEGDFYLWPLFEGRMITAGVMGIVPGLRYILLTPALLETMSIAEMEAVLAHEIGHVKKKHLLLYVALIGGFSLLAGLLVEPLIYLLLAQDIVSRLIIKSGISAESMLTVVGAAPLLLFLILYFRYIFGYFIRNFERQADLFSLSSMGSGTAMISAFEKIAALSGNIRDEPNWHHFGIGERIDCIEAAEKTPERIKSHNHKVNLSLLIYLTVIVAISFSVRFIPTETLVRQYQENYAEAVLIHKATQEPERAIWQQLLGDLMMGKEMEAQALTAYGKAFSLNPTSPEILNNYAWLLLTSKDLSLRDPFRALTLARSAAAIADKGYILDTLAHAYWANGLIEEAVSTENQAMTVDRGQRRFYLSRIAEFTSRNYEESLMELQSDQPQPVSREEQQ